MRIRFAVACLAVMACLAVWLVEAVAPAPTRPSPGRARKAQRLARIVPATLRRPEPAPGERHGREAGRVKPIDSGAGGGEAVTEGIGPQGEAGEANIQRAALQGAGGEAVPEAERRAEREKARAKLFAGPVPRISIRIPPASAAALDSDPRSYAPCAVVSDGKTYEGVGIHLKGAVGSFRPLRDRPGLTLSFKRFSGGKLFHGLRKIHLNNSVQDPSLLAEILCSEMFLACGVPAARATHARVELDGRDMGLYVLVEGMDAAFLDRHFGGHGGTLYDGGFCQDVTGDMRRLSGPGGGVQGGMRDLTRAATEMDLDLRWRRLGQALDLDRFIAFMAVEVMVWDWDGYVLKPNNFRLHQDGQSGRITFLPHGMDQMFQSTEGPILQGMAGLVARAVMECPEGSALYLDKLADLEPKVFALADVSSRIDGLVQRAMEALSDQPQRAARMRAGAESLRRRIEARARSVAEQLRRRPRPLDFDAEGRADLGSAAWSTRLDSEEAFARESQESGRRELCLQARGTGGPALASFRLAVLLPAGRYRFEGRARTSGVEALNDRKGEGAGLRLSGTTAPRTNGLKGDSDWTNLRHDFELRGAARHVTLVVELRARSGEARFDAASLRLLHQRN